MACKLKEAFDGAIRPAVPADIDAIVAIEKSCFPAEEKFSREFMSVYLEASQRIPAYPTFIAAPDSDAKGPAGYVLGQIKPGGTGEIGSLAVTPPYEGRGLGRALLERVSQSLQEAGAHKLALQVRVDNPGAIHLYETSGFVKTRLLPGYYPRQDADAKDAFEMVKQLSQPAARPPRQQARLRL